eukprot:157326_1
MMIFQCIWLCLYFFVYVDTWTPALQIPTSSTSSSLTYSKLDLRQTDFNHLSHLPSNYIIQRECPECATDAGIYTRRRRTVPTKRMHEIIADHTFSHHELNDANVGGSLCCANEPCRSTFVTRDPHFRKWSKRRSLVIPEIDLQCIHISPPLLPEASISLHTMNLCIINAYASLIWTILCVFVCSIIRPLNPTKHIHYKLFLILFLCLNLTSCSATVWSSPTVKKGSPTLRPIVRIMPTSAITFPHFPGIPTSNPTVPTADPTILPSSSSTTPTMDPTISPSTTTSNPTIRTTDPSISPSSNPTMPPSRSTTISPSRNPTISPSAISTRSPSLNPTIEHTAGRSVSIACSRYNLTFKGIATASFTHINASIADIENVINELYTSIQFDQLNITNKEHLVLVKTVVVFNV